MSRSQRAEALYLTRSGREIQAPSIPDLEPNSPEALAFLEPLESHRYAALALTIDELFDHTLASRADRPPDGLLPMKSIIPVRDEWDQLDGDINNTLIEDVEAIRQTVAFKNAAGFNRLFAALDTDRQVSVDRQLYAGIGTGKNAILLFLRNAPELISYHASDELPMPKIEEVMRHPASKRLVYILAKIGINQLMAAEDVLCSHTETPASSKDNPQLNPDDFKLVYDRRGHAGLAYNDFTKLEVPAGYTPHPWVPPVKAPTLVVDFPNRRPFTIGCPVTLLEGRLGQFMNWVIDVAAERELWQRDTC